MKFFEILTEGRVDEFKSKYSNKFNKEQLDKIVNSVPQKFLDWVGNNLDAINFEKNIQTTSKSLSEFEKISSNLPKTDINSYSTIDELVQSLENYRNRPRRNYPQVQGGNIVFDDGRFFVVNPQTHAASCYYGKGTKWCTVADSDYQFNKYNEDGKLFYILDKTKSSNDPNYKIALLKKFDGEETYYNAKDESFTGFNAFIGDEKYNEIISSIKDYLNQEYSEQIKIFSDKVAAKKEKQRQESLRLQRILNDRREEADERRADGEWTLGPDCPEEGLKAHALLDWLVDQSDVEVKTNEDFVEIDRLQSEIQILSDEYDNSEDTRTELLDEISDLEDELQEIENKIDVYNIIPTGEFYDTTEFQVIDAGLDDRRYAVGTEQEMKDSCYEYVEQLIDDIGYEGFNRSFAMNHIDKSKVEDYARDIYEDDVSQNPEVYLDESERELSDEQEEEIKVLNYRIAQARQTIERLEEFIDDDVTVEEKIDELEDVISDLESEIEDVKDSPEGEFPEELIDEKVEDLVSDATYDVESFLSNYGLEWENFIDKEEFIEAVIEEDGYGHTINSYDGNADEMKVMDQWFYVMRID
jgi:hypothetical protein